MGREFCDGDGEKWMCAGMSPAEGSFFHVTVMVDIDEDVAVV